MNDKYLHTLEYGKMLALLEAHAQSEIGAERARALRPVFTLGEAEALLRQTDEADGLYRRTGKLPVAAFPDLRPLLARLHAQLSISPAELLSTAALLRVSRECRDMLQGGDTEGLLCNMANLLSSHRSIEDEIRRCILSEEEIADNASPELARIRRQMKIVSERVREKLNAMIRSATTQKYLQDPIITVRNGRYALPVKAEYRAQVPGLIHDQSSSGATLFIEPTAVVELGNETKRLQSEEKNEIERILAALTALIAPFSDELYNACELLGEIDMIFARALLGRDMSAVCPKLNADGRIHIRKGRHPLLPRESVVPVDIWLGDTFTTLIITGPNTGGKTVTLKTVGLFTLMAASGMFVPAEIGTELSIFRAVYADIGDEQSIEQSLSTFSSHMTNTVSILEQADDRSLVLLDELGAGTDPIEGAALAQAILESLTDRKARVVATTHYSEIKAFALTHAGMQNASMEFDVDRLCPTYRLFVGIPGKSNAFEISSRLGLSAGIIERARDFLQKKDVAFETVLSEAEQARKDAERDRAAMEAARIEAERIRADLEKARAKLETEKAALRAKARDDARQTVLDTRREMEQLIAELRSVKSIDQRSLERAVQGARDRVRTAEARLGEQLVRAADGGDAPKTVKPGDRVHLLSVDKDATVLKAPDSRGEALVQAGVIKMSVPLADLRILDGKQEKKKVAQTIVLASERGAALEVDVRGQTVDEACSVIDRFIDDTAFTGIQSFNIIHGKGTGALRSGVQDFLRRHPKVKSYRMGAYGEGDAGVTVVTLK